MNLQKGGADDTNNVEKNRCVPAKPVTDAYKQHQLTENTGCNKEGGCFGNENWRNPVRWK